MTPLKLTLVICFGLFCLAALSCVLSGDRDKYALMGLASLLFALGYFIIGIILCIPVSSRNVGKAMLLCAGILLIVGLSVCSANPVNL